MFLFKFSGAPGLNLPTLKLGHDLLITCYCDLTTLLWRMHFYCINLLYSVGEKLNSPITIAYPFTFKFLSDAFWQKFSQFTYLLFSISTWRKSEHCANIWIYPWHEKFCGFIRQLQFNYTRLQWQVFTICCLSYLMSNHWSFPTKILLLLQFL